MPEQEPLTRLIATARRHIKQAVGRRLGSHRLSPQRFWLLVNLYEAPALSLRGLAERLRMDEPSASRMIANLTRQRLVRARPHPGDRRRRRLELTAEGAALARKLLPVAREVRQAAETGFTPREKQTLRRLLTRVIENVKGLGGDAALSEGKHDTH